MDTSKLLHIYGQHVWHDETYIVGNRQGLEALRAAIDEALKGEKAGASLALVEVADGESYSAVVALEDSPLDGEIWQNLFPPYQNCEREAKDTDVFPALLPCVMKALDKAYGTDED